jgi:pyroglutamyl-peptidase
MVSFYTIKKEKDFKISDEKGNTPKNEKIDKEKEIDYYNNTKININKIIENIENHYQKDLIEKSFNAGKYICNYLYYKSLEFTEKNKGDSIFIHIPSHETIDLEAQIIFISKYLIKEFY